jgi:hypothetical protein
MNVRNQACCLVALLSMWGVAYGQDPQFVEPASGISGSILPETVPTPLPETRAAGTPLYVAYVPPLAVLDRAYYFDKKRRDTAIRQYDRLLQGYPSSWAHSPHAPLYVGPYPGPRAEAGFYSPSTSAYRDAAGSGGYSVYRNPASTATANTYRPSYGNPFPSSSSTPSTSPAPTRPSPQPAENIAPQPETVPAPPANPSKPVEL